MLAWTHRSEDECGPLPGETTDNGNRRASHAQTSRNRLLQAVDGRGDVLPLFADDAYAFFPKHPYARNKQEINELVGNIAPHVEVDTAPIRPPTQRPSTKRTAPRSSKPQRQTKEAPDIHNHQKTPNYAPSPRTEG